MSTEVIKAKKPELVRKDNGLYLADGEMELFCDFSESLTRLKTENLGRELVIRAAKIKDDKPEHLVIDATAGLGEDSLLLAAAGYRVLMYEYNPVIAALLRDAVDRARSDERLSVIAQRMEVFEEDSIKALFERTEPVDVVLLDPMFPQRKKSGLIKKKFQLLQQIETPCDREEELLSAAFSARPKKILIKRPLKGAFLAGKKPDYCIKGSTVRYDCFFLG